MAEEIALRVTLFSMLFLGLGASLRIRQSADEAGGVVPRSADTPGVAAALRICGAIYYGSILLWLAYPPLVSWAGVHLPEWLRWLGIALVAGGLALGLAALWHLGRSTTPTAVARTDAELVVSGPYRWIRHPLYTSMWLSVPGVALVSANLLPLLSGAATVAVLTFRTRREERELVERFGDRYRRYMSRTGRFLPGPGNIASEKPEIGHLASTVDDRPTGAPQEENEARRNGPGWS